MRPTDTVLIDYNGPAEWSLPAIQERYTRYALELGVEAPLSMQPQRSSKGSREWVYPLMFQVISGAEAGDAACIELAVQFVESGHSQPFGRILKAQAARALRRTALSSSQAARLRRRVLTMLDANGVCREFREYAKLLRVLGLPPSWRALCAHADRSNIFVQHYLRYFERHASVRPEAVA